MNTYLLNTIPKLWIKGEWCINEGKHPREMHVFRRSCGNTYWLSNSELAHEINNLILED